MAHSRGGGSRPVEAPRAGALRLAALALWALVPAAPCASGQVRSIEPPRWDSRAAEIRLDPARPCNTPFPRDERAGRAAWLARGEPLNPGASAPQTLAGDSPVGDRPALSPPPIDPRRWALLLSFLAGCFGSLLMTAAVLPSLMRRQGAYYVREYRRRVEAGSRVIVVHRGARETRVVASSRYPSKSLELSRGEAIASPHFHSTPFNSWQAHVATKLAPADGDDEGGVLQRIVEQNIELRE